MAAAHLRGPSVPKTAWIAGCTRKAAYVTGAEARNFERRKGGLAQCEVYRCKTCRLWHTSRTGKVAPP